MTQSNNHIGIIKYHPVFLTIMPNKVPLCYFEARYSSKGPRVEVKLQTSLDEDAKDRVPGINYVPNASIASILGVLATTKWWLDPL